MHLSALLFSHISFTPRHPSWLQGGCQSTIHNMFSPVQTGKKLCFFHLTHSFLSGSKRSRFPQVSLARMMSHGRF